MNYSDTILEAVCKVGAELSARREDFLREALVLVYGVSVIDNARKNPALLRSLVSSCTLEIHDVKQEPGTSGAERLVFRRQGLTILERQFGPLVTGLPTGVLAGAVA